MPGSETAANKSYYEVLGVEKTASPKEIRLAYHAKIRATHPDKNYGVDTEEQCICVQRAYCVLKNPVKRRQYDSRFPSELLIPKKEMSEDERDRFWQDFCKNFSELGRQVARDIENLRAQQARYDETLRKRRDAWQTFCQAQNRPPELYEYGTDLRLCKSISDLTCCFYQNKYAVDLLRFLIEQTKPTPDELDWVNRLDPSTGSRKYPSLADALQSLDSEGFERAQVLLDSGASCVNQAPHGVWGYPLDSVLSACLLAGRVEIPKEQPIVWDLMKKMVEMGAVSMRSNLYSEEALKALLVHVNRWGNEEFSAIRDRFANREKNGIFVTAWHGALLFADIGQIDQLVKRVEQRQRWQEEEEKKEHHLFHDGFFTENLNKWNALLQDAIDREDTRFILDCRIKSGVLNPITDHTLYTARADTADLLRRPELLGTTLTIEQLQEALSKTALPTQLAALQDYVSSFILPGTTTVDLTLTPLETMLLYGDHKRVVVAVAMRERPDIIPSSPPGEIARFLYYQHFLHLTDHAPNKNGGCNSSTKDLLEIITPLLQGELFFNARRCGQSNTDYLKDTYLHKDCTFPIHLRKFDAALVQHTALNLYLEDMDHEILQPLSNSPSIVAVRACIEILRSLSLSYAQKEIDHIRYQTDMAQATSACLESLKNNRSFYEKFCSFFSGIMETMRHLLGPKREAHHTDPHNIASSACFFKPQDWRGVVEFNFQKLSRISPASVSA